MKRAILSHPKTYDLASRLKCGRPAALGYLMLLFDFVAEHAPQGDVGKWADGAIAAACDWTGDPAAFVAALTDSKWLDGGGKHRLLVHDWGANCEQWVRAKVKNKGLAGN